MTDRERLEFTELVQLAMEPIVLDLKREIATGFTQILEYAMSDLAQVLESRNGAIAREMLRLREEDLAKRPRAGFTKG